MSEHNKLVALQSMNLIPEVNIMAIRDRPSIFALPREEEATIGAGG